MVFLDGGLSPQQIVRSLFRSGHSKSYSLLTDFSKRSSASPLRKTITIVGSLTHYFKKHEYNVSSSKDSIKKSRKSSRSQKKSNYKSSSDFTVSSRAISEDDDSSTAKHRFDERRRFWQRKKRPPPEPCSEFFKRYGPNDIIGY
ncbi:unnamed protein product [Enterobius vermicularis]|uniref:Uncharacterized protein n=1 Tax=Enterobius vermicularis TaxID=51028 RepID=A0A0N4VCQ9_ENTVE|nr:unnamed protein product [Enterobius vermicularis]